MEELIKRVQEQLDNNWAVDKKDIQRLVNYYIMEDALLTERIKTVLKNERNLERR